MPEECLRPMIRAIDDDGEDGHHGVDVILAEHRHTRIYRNAIAAAGIVARSVIVGHSVIRR